MYWKLRQKQNVGDFLSSSGMLNTNVEDERKAVLRFGLGSLASSEVQVEV
jgi:hypothetical protein